MRWRASPSPSVRIAILITALTVAECITSHAARATGEFDGLEAKGEESYPALDIQHARARRSVSAVADQLDRFFVDDRIEEGLNETRVRLGVGVRFSEDDAADPLFRFRLDLSLPRTERRLGVVIGSLVDENDPDQGIADPSDETNVAGFLRFFALQRDAAQVTIDGGLRFSPTPDPFMRLRGFREFAFGRTLLRPTQQVFWRSSEGFGERSRLDIDRRLSRNSLARLRGQATFSEATPGAELDLAGLLYRRLDRRSALRFEVGIRSFTDPPRVIESYRTGVLYRRAIYRHWLFAEIEPQLHFRREDGYRFAPALLLRLDTIIGPAPASD